MPKVSIVIPVYNAGELLRIAVDSILAQTEKDFELILMDDGSTDDGITAKLADGYAAADKRIRVIHKANQGVMKTREVGIEQAQGEYVYVCDQDDYLHPQFLEYALWACKTHNLDYLKILHEFGSINAKERLAPLGDFASVPLVVIDNETNSGAEIGDAAGKLHTDAWAQFGKRELLREYPCTVYDVSRVFHLVNKAKRWGVEEVPLYYYHGDIAGSMIHRAIPKGWIDELHAGWDKVYDLYAGKAVDARGQAIFSRILEKQIVPHIKVIFHMIKRLNKLNDRKTRRAVWREFGDMARDFLFCRKVPAKIIGTKHYIEYLFFAVFFGGGAK